MHHGCFAVFAFQGMEIEDMALVAVENEFRKEQRKARGRNAVTTSPSPGRVGVSAAESEEFHLRKPWKILQQFQQELSAKFCGLVRALQFVYKTQICFHFVLPSHPLLSQLSTNLTLPLFLQKGLELLSSNYSDVKQFSIAKLSYKNNNTDRKNIAWWILISCVLTLITVLILTGMTSQHSDCSCFFSSLFYCGWLVSVWCPV